MGSALFTHSFAAAVAFYVKQSRCVIQLRRYVFADVQQFAPTMAHRAVRLMAVFGGGQVLGNGHA